MRPSHDQLWGHPKGLYLLFSTELWERFSYYAMRAILVLYLTDQTAHGGLGFSEASALQLYGLYTGLVYITPIFGGALADRYLGRRKAILIGGVIMALGQFTLALPHAWGHSALLLYLGLGLLIVGNGLFKPNISTMVGQLYDANDHRRDGAFTIFYMGINIGAMLSAIIAGSMAAAYGWKAGFICAGVGMLISLLTQLVLAQRYLGDMGRRPSLQQHAAERAAKKAPLTRQEVDRLKVLLVMGLFTIVFWTGFEQAGGLMNIYAQDYTDRVIFGFEVPAAWFQSLNPLFIILLSPLLAALWTRMGSREPTSPLKFALGLFFLAVGFLCMIGAVIEQREAGSASMIWLVGAYFFHTTGELCLSPVGLSLATKLSPLRIGSLMMGVWFAFIALGNYLSGAIGALVGEAGPMAIFGGITAVGLASAALLWLLSAPLVRWMHGAEDKSTAIDEAIESPAA